MDRRYLIRYKHHNPSLPFFLDYFLIAQKMLKNKQKIILGSGQGSLGQGIP
jgi:hypothetical protein